MSSGVNDNKKANFAFLAERGFHYFLILLSLLVIVLPFGIVGYIYRDNISKAYHRFVANVWKRATEDTSDGGPKYYIKNSETGEFYELDDRDQVIDIISLKELRENPEEISEDPNDPPELHEGVAKPLPDFIVDKVPRDELESLKP